MAQDWAFIELPISGMFNTMATTLEDALRARTRPAAEELAVKDEKGRIRCLACAHRCLIAEGHAGICKVRFVQDGVLRVPWGYAAGVQVDPIEKKPFFHAFPGTDALSFGMLGCDFHCSYCQNWISSQTLRDAAAGTLPRDVSPETLVDLAVRRGATTVSSTYNEPLITSEWAVDILKLAKDRGIPGSYVSNGHATPEVLDFIRPYVDLFKVDLKSWSEKHYRDLGGNLQAVLDTIKRLVDQGFWVEVVTLVVPTFNDSDEELSSIAEFLAGVSKDIPWHLTAFHRDYKMTGPPNTPVHTLLHGVEIGRSKGLRFVYAGNRPGQLSSYENTYCPECGALLIERYGFLVQQNRLTDEGKCPECACSIPGRWR